MRPTRLRLFPLQMTREGLLMAPHRDFAKVTIHYEMTSNDSLYGSCKPVMWRRYPKPSIAHLDEDV